MPAVAPDDVSRPTGGPGEFGVWTIPRNDDDERGVCSVGASRCEDVAERTGAQHSLPACSIARVWALSSHAAGAAGKSETGTGRSPIQGREHGTQLNQDSFSYVYG